MYLLHYKSNKNKRWNNSQVLISSNEVTNRLHNIFSLSNSLKSKRKRNKLYKTLLLKANAFRLKRPFKLTRSYHSPPQVPNVSLYCHRKIQSRLSWGNLTPLRKIANAALPSKWRNISWTSWISRHSMKESKRWNNSTWIKRGRGLETNLALNCWREIEQRRQD